MTQESIVSSSNQPEKLCSEELDASFGADNNEINPTIHLMAHVPDPAFVTHDRKINSFSDECGIDLDAEVVVVLVVVMATCSPGVKAVIQSIDTLTQVRRVHRHSTVDGNLGRLGLAVGQTAACA